MVHGREQSVSVKMEQMSTCVPLPQVLHFFFLPLRTSERLSLNVVKTEITLEVSKARQPFRDVFFTIERQLDKCTGMHALPSSVSVVSLSSHEKL